MAKILNPALKTLYGVWERIDRESHPDAITLSNELPLSAYQGKTVEESIAMLIEMEEKQNG